MEDANILWDRETAELAKCIALVDKYSREAVANIEVMPSGKAPIADRVDAVSDLAAHMILVSTFAEIAEDMLRHMRARMYTEIERVEQTETKEET